MKILIASQIDAAAIEKLRQAHDVRLSINAPSQHFFEDLADREALIFRSGVQITAQVMVSVPNLRLLIRAGSGVDNLDLDYVRRKKLSFFRIPKPGARAVAEMSFAFMLALSRRIFEADQLTRKGRWAKSEFNGYLLHKKH